MTRKFAPHLVVFVSALLAVACHSASVQRQAAQPGPMTSPCAGLRDTVIAATGQSAAWTPGTLAVSPQTQGVVGQGIVVQPALPTRATDRRFVVQWQGCTQDAPLATDTVEVACAAEYPQVLASATGTALVTSGSEPSACPATLTLWTPDHQRLCTHQQLPTRPATAAWRGDQVVVATVDGPHPSRQVRLTTLDSHCTVVAERTVDLGALGIEDPRPVQLDSGDTTLVLVLRTLSAGQWAVVGLDANTAAVRWSVVPTAMCAQSVAVTRLLPTAKQPALGLPTPQGPGDAWWIAGVQAGSDGARQDGTAQVQSWRATATGVQALPALPISAPCNRILRPVATPTGALAVMHTTNVAAGLCTHVQPLTGELPALARLNLAPQELRFVDERWHGLWRDIINVQAQLHYVTAAGAALPAPTTGTADAACQ